MTSFILITCILLVTPAESKLDYPDSPRGTTVDDYHGTAVADPYRWLEGCPNQRPGLGLGR